MFFLAPGNGSHPARGRLPMPGNGEWTLPASRRTEHGAEDGGQKLESYTPRDSLRTIPGNLRFAAKPTPIMTVAIKMIEVGSGVDENWIT